MSTIRFELRKEKKDKNGFAPVRIIYQVSGIRKYYNTTCRVYFEEWNSLFQRAERPKAVAGDSAPAKAKRVDIMTANEIKQVNAALDKLKLEIGDIEQRFTLDGIAYNSEMVVERLSKVDTPKVLKAATSKQVYDFIDLYIKEKQGEMAKGSVTVYNTLKRHLQNYERGNRLQITFDKINPDFFTGFQNYLFKLRKKDKEGNITPLLNDITVAKQLSTLKTFLVYAQQKNIDVPNNFRSFKFKRQLQKNLEVIALTRKEYNTLYSMNLSSRPAWEKVRDAFIFSCNTGYRYSDLKQLRREHIIDGRIELTAMKTKNRGRVKITPHAAAILKKYEAYVHPLGGIPSNQKCNENLHRICEFAGFTERQEIVRNFAFQRKSELVERYKLISMHSGRKTFATLSIEMGMKIPEVMKAGGWTDFKSFSRYMEVSDASVDNAVDETWGAIQTQKLKAV